MRTKARQKPCAYLWDLLMCFTRDIKAGGLRNIGYRPEIIIKSKSRQISLFQNICNGTSNQPSRPQRWCDSNNSY